MAAVPVEKQFAGQARLVRLLLWRVGDSTDIDTCLAEARASNMIDESDEAFLRQCMAHEEAVRDTDSSVSTGTENASTTAHASITAPVSDFPITQETVARLRRCADKLNRADAA